jgi:hypothetical protein
MSAGDIDGNYPFVSAGDIDFVSAEDIDGNYPALSVGDIDGNYQ